MVTGALAAGLLTFSQTFAFFGDEAFHLLASQLILAGKRPYLDFFYPQVPLYVYVNAGWMRVFGDTWRSAHVLSTLLTVASILLIAQFAFTRLPEHGWGLICATAAALLVGLNLTVIRFGTIGQPYALCLFLIAVAFRLVIRAVDRPGGALPALAGLCAGAAATASLLVAPVAPILLVWMMKHDEAGSRLRKGVQFVVGTAIPLLLLLWLIARGPRQTVFNVLEYHLFYRRAASGWEGKALRWTLHVVAGWLDSTQGLLLALLAGVGLLFVIGWHAWDARRRAEFYLCAWLTVGAGVYLSVASPTFPQYFVFLVPFLGILAAVGIFALGSRIWPMRVSTIPMLLVVGLYSVGLAKTAYHQRKDFQYIRWQDIEEIGREVKRVTPSDGLVYADAATYFVSRRTPPSGLEHPITPNLRLPPALAASLHVVPQSQIDEWLAAGRFSTAVLWEGDPRIESLGVHRLYSSRAAVRGYYIFSNRVAPPAISK